MTRGKSNMTSFLDLTLIMVGAIAMLAQVNITNIETGETTRIGEHETAEYFHYATDRLFADGEARLSDKGLDIIAKLAPRIGDARAHVTMPIVRKTANSRLNNWELAAARTAAIFHALQGHGVSESSLQSGPMRVAVNPQDAKQKDPKIEIILIAPKS
jgi:flagellar motor protein MotB